MGKGEENSITPSNGDYINDVCTPLSCNTDVTSAAYNRQQSSCRHCGVDQLHNKTTIASFLKVHTYVHNASIIPYGATISNGAAYLIYLALVGLGISRQ